MCTRRTIANFHYNFVSIVLCKWEGNLVMCCAWVKSGCLPPLLCSNTKSKLAVVLCSITGTIVLLVFFNSSQYWTICTCVLIAQHMTGCTTHNGKTYSLGIDSLTKYRLLAKKKPARNVIVCAENNNRCCLCVLWCVAFPWRIFAVLKQHLLRSGYTRQQP